MRPLHVVWCSGNKCLDFDLRSFPLCFYVIVKQFLCLDGCRKAKSQTELNVFILRLITVTVSVSNNNMAVQLSIKVKM